MPPKKQKFADVIGRIEYVRTLKGLNKSRFSGEIGMRPQTYNNFIGAQGSKPNVELIAGLYQRFGVNPAWLLSGKGAVFMEDAPQAGGGTAQAGAPGDLAVAELGAQVEATRARSAEMLRQRIRNMSPLLRDVEARMRQAERSQAPLFESLTDLLRGYLEHDPALVIEEIEALLQRLQDRLGQS